jgi:hypothetical protein
MPVFLRYVRSFMFVSMGSRSSRKTAASVIDHSDNYNRLARIEAEWICIPALGNAFTLHSETLSFYLASLLNDKVIS